MHDELHCPFCGSTDISYRKEDFNFKAAFWACLFLSLWGLIFGWCCRKRIVCRCEDCENEFSFYE